MHHNPKPPDKDRSWWPVIAAAIIGAIATILAGLIANGAGALHLSVSPVSTPTVTITPPPAPTVTVTAPSSGSSETGSATCLPGQNCKVTNLKAPMGPASNEPTGINLSQGVVGLNNPYGDIQFYAASDGAPELAGYNDTYSIDVTAQNASRQQCMSATDTAPDPNPITDFHPGLLVCVAIQGGIALVEQTKPLGSSNTLYLQETYWPNSS